MCIFHLNEGLRKKKSAHDDARKATEENHSPCWRKQHFLKATKQMPVTWWLPRVKERTACTAIRKTNQKPWSGLMESPWIANGQHEKHCNKGRKLQLHLSRASTLILEQIVHLCLQPTAYYREVNFRHKHTDFTDSLQELQGTCNNSNLKTQTLWTDYVSTVKKGVETNSNLKKYLVHCNESH